MNYPLCPRLEHSLRLLGKPWNGLILYFLLQQPQRFHQLQEAIGISGRILSLRLKDLEKQGLLQRLIFNEHPVRIEYSLTAKGKALGPTIETLQGWSQAWLPFPNNPATERTTK